MTNQTAPDNIPNPTIVSADELHQWQAATGPLHCPHCGDAAVNVVLLDTDTRPREVLTCNICGQSDEFLHPPYGATLPLMGMGLRIARAQFLRPWQACPQGVRRYPRVARLLAFLTGRRPQQTVQTWGYQGQDWPHLDEVS